MAKYTKEENQKHEIIIPFVSISSVSAFVGGTGVLIAAVEGVGLTEPLTIKITNTSSDTI